MYILRIDQVWLEPDEMPQIGEIERFLTMTISDLPRY